MRRLPPLIAALLAALTIAAPAVAAPALRAPSQGSAMSEPLVSARSATLRPPGFATNARQAILAAEGTPQMQALHRREHPLYVRALIWAGERWWINFWKGTKTVAEVDVSPGGHVTGVWLGPQATAVYTRGHYSPWFDRPYVVGPFALLFLVPFLSLRRGRRLLLLDGLVLLSFLISYALFDHAQLESAVWLAYPPLLYLLGRLLAIGLSRARMPSLPAWLTTRPLLVGLLVITAARIALCFASGVTEDVGYASVLGAHRIDHGQALYFSDPNHGDTYGPIAYLAYVPFELAFPWSGRWDYLMAAHVASLVFDLITIGALVLLGRRLRGGREGTRLGLAFGWVYAACPFTLLALVGHTNDELVAMLTALSLLAFASPAGRGALLGLAAAAKFSPAGLLPLYAGPRSEGRRGALRCVTAFVGVVAASVLAFLPSGGVEELWQRTLGYQLTRVDVFSPWALHPSLAAVKVAVEVAALGLAASMALWPRRRSLAHTCALAGAVTIALQLPAVHWFYYYIVWFVPFVAVALLAGDPAPAESAPPRHAEGADRMRAPREPVLVGA